MKGLKYIYLPFKIGEPLCNRTGEKYTTSSANSLYHFISLQGIRASFGH